MVRRLPLHIHIATLFIALILCVGLILAGYNYYKQTEIILASSEQLFERIYREVLFDLRAHYQSVADDLDLIAHYPLQKAQSLEQRLQLLPLFAEILEKRTHLAALQIAFQNGDYFIVRPLHEPGMKKRFSAPVDAHFVADQIAAGSSQIERFYFTQNLEQLERHELQYTDYDPKKRPWYRIAFEYDWAVTPPYFYYFIHQVGITLSKLSHEGQVVIAADLTLNALSKALQNYQITPSTQVLIYDQNEQVIAYPQVNKLIIKKNQDRFQLAKIDELKQPVLQKAQLDHIRQDQKLAFDFQGSRWLGQVKKIDFDSSYSLYFAILVPENELLESAYQSSRQTLFIALLTLLIALPLAWLLAHKITRSLRVLNEEIRSISRLDFQKRSEIKTFIKEIFQLAQAMQLMKDTINKFLRLITALAGEQNFEKMLDRIAQETLDASQADGVGILLLSSDQQKLKFTAWKSHRLDPLHLNEIAVAETRVFEEVLRSKRYTLFQLSQKSCDLFSQNLFQSFDCRQIQLAVFPLCDRSGQTIGILYALYLQPINSEVQQRLQFVKTLTGFASVSLETQLLLRSQKELLQSFIQLVADAIDAKSPYTGTHCHRVPEITEMIAQAASASHEPPFADYQPDAKQKEALHIAAWLHDCGKMTTPEFVIDKSTKLECIYDRIHEIRMRFEVIKRDVQIDYWRQRAAYPEQEAELKQALERELKRLDEEFAFIAHCNTESVSPQDIERIQQIARRTWQRTLDDTLGIAWEERQRKPKEQSLPVTEYLLADKTEHLISRPAKEIIPANNPWNFKLQAPQYKYNRGEIYNLSIEQGTLTAEERYIINDHIVQTIIMLQKLPYPEHLKQVPLIAGSHHERMDGHGYPWQLKADQIPLEGRMLAIADIFEALTAQDRPYKQPKTLSQTLAIMDRMAKEGHIDPDLYRLFIESGIHLQYARRYLKPEQIDVN